MNLALSLAIVFATLLGPVLAVCVTRRTDDYRRLRERRTEIFRALMGSRRVPLSPDKVRALNMIEIDFHGVRAVQSAYQEVINHATLSGPAPADWAERHRSLMTRLLSEIATVLGYSLQQLDLLEGGYYPQPFIDIELEQQAVRRSLIEVLSGRRPLLTSSAAPTPPSPFPPPPGPGVE